MAFGGKLKTFFYEQRGIFFNALFFVYLVTLQPLLLRLMEGVIVPARADGLRYRGVERQGICPLARGRGPVVGVGLFFPFSRLPFSIRPNPFTSFDTLPGHEAELFNISSRRVGTYKGDRIGEGLGAGCTFARRRAGAAGWCDWLSHDNLISGKIEVIETNHKYAPILGKLRCPISEWVEPLSLLIYKQMLND